MMEADKSRVEIFANFLDRYFVWSTVNRYLLGKFLRKADGIHWDWIETQGCHGGR